MACDEPQENVGGSALSRGHRDEGSPGCTVVARVGIQMCRGRRDVCGGGTVQRAGCALMWHASK